MKKFSPVMLIVVALLSGCASSGGSRSTNESGSLWNPLNWSWSSLNPVGWFGRSLTVSDRGVGELTGMTSMDEKAIDNGLAGHYDLRQGMRGENGRIVRFWQALEDKQVRLVVSGVNSVEKIEVMDPAISTDSGVKVGTPFSDLYSKAFGNCEKGSGQDRRGVSCQVVGSSHLRYVFTGDWHGPESLMPADDTLKNWTLSKIIWTR